MPIIPESAVIPCSYRTSESPQGALWEERREFWGREGEWSPDTCKILRDNDVAISYCMAPLCSERNCPIALGHEGKITPNQVLNGTEIDGEVIVGTRNIEVFNLKKFRELSNTDPKAP